MQHAALGNGLKGGTTQDEVDSFLEEVTEAQLGSNFLRQLPELPVIGVGHAREPGAKPGRGLHREEHIKCLHENTRLRAMFGLGQWISQTPFFVSENVKQF